MPYLFGKPLYVWGGITTGALIILTMYFGFNAAKYGLKTHKIFAYITLILALAHGISALSVWLF